MNHHGEFQTLAGRRVPLGNFPNRAGATVGPRLTRVRAAPEAAVAGTHRTQRHRVTENRTRHRTTTNAADRTGWVRVGDTASPVAREPACGWRFGPRARRINRMDFLHHGAGNAGARKLFPKIRWSAD
jgi:hypothetical protein